MTSAREIHYMIWRMDMWTKNYGSHRVIDRAVRMGVLKPFAEYPERTKRRGMTFGDWMETKLS